MGEKLWECLKPGKVTHDRPTANRLRRTRPPL